jgi:aminodeoxychorismate lyase
MIVFVNGRFVSEEEAVVSVFDRSFLYGDGLFETMRVLNGVVFRWEQHWRRLERGAAFLKITLPPSSDSLRDSAAQLVARNEMPDGLLRLTLSRGIGRRGYSPKGAEQPMVIMSCHAGSPANLDNSPAWRLIVSSFRLPASEPLAQFKTCNKLPQILARAEADAAQADEALLLNTDGFVVEASSSNLFWIDDSTVCTPPLASGILPGVTREIVFELCPSLGLTTRQAAISAESIRSVQGVFLSLSSAGIAECVSLDGYSLRQSPLVQKIRAAYDELLRQETRRGVERERTEKTEG